MNFYISNSKKNKLLFTFLLLILLVIGLSIALGFYASMKTSEITWIENKQSKARHFQLNQFNDLDYIFIGSSRTIFHISTDLFKKHQKNIYNFGVSGMVLTDYPYFIKQAVKLRPKSIVLSISVQHLFQDTMDDDFEEVTLTDLKHIYYTQTWSIKKVATFNYIKNHYNLFAFSDAIYIRLKQVIQKFKLYLSAEETHQKNADISINNIQDLIDCSVFSKSVVSRYKTVLKCSNGDGILLGHYIDAEYKGEFQHLKRINKNYLALLNAMTSSIQDAGIQPIIILEPILLNNYHYDAKDIQDKLSVSCIYDLTDNVIETDMWADIRHLNNVGRVYYSKLLINQLSSDTCLY